MAANGIPMVFGGALFTSPEEAASWYPLLEQYGIKCIDTAVIYGESESFLGQSGAASKFTIDTKHPGGFSPASPSKEAVITSFNESLKRLNADSVDVYYLHAPYRKPDANLKDTLDGLEELHKQGKFKRLGLSNFLSKEVEEIVELAKANNLVVPSVYQGNYNAMGRLTETELLPVLRKHNIAFYAYSPIAGGFLAKTKEQLLSADNRFGKGDALSQIYNGMYNRPSFLNALDIWGEVAKEEGVSLPELAYRWIFFHSQLRGDLGDVVLVGASKASQLASTIAAVEKGPLSAGAVEKIEAMWETIKADSQLDNFQMLSAAGLV